MVGWYADISEILAVSFFKANFLQILEMNSQDLQNVDTPASNNLVLWQKCIEKPQETTMKKWRLMLIFVLPQDLRYQK